MLSHYVLIHNLGLMLTVTLFDFSHGFRLALYLYGFPCVFRLAMYRNSENSTITLLVKSQPELGSFGVCASPRKLTLTQHKKSLGNPPASCLQFCKEHGKKLLISFIVSGPDSVSACCSLYCTTSVAKGLLHN